jgi:hypothetical protein
VCHNRINACRCLEGCWAPGMHVDSLAVQTKRCNVVHSVLGCVICPRAKLYLCTHLPPLLLLLLLVPPCQVEQCSQ